MPDDKLVMAEDDEVEIVAEEQVQDKIVVDRPAIPVDVSFTTAETFSVTTFTPVRPQTMFRGEKSIANDGIMTAEQVARLGAQEDPDLRIGSFVPADRMFAQEKMSREWARRWPAADDYLKAQRFAAEGGVNIPPPPQGQYLSPEEIVRLAASEREEVRSTAPIGNDDGWTEIIGEQIRGMSSSAPYARTTVPPGASPNRINPENAADILNDLMDRSPGFRKLVEQRLSSATAKGPVRWDQPFDPPEPNWRDILGDPPRGGRDYAREILGDDLVDRSRRKR